MAVPERLRLIGATASPYTRKMLSLLRYRLIGTGGVKEPKLLRSW